MGGRIGPHQLRHKKRNAVVALFSPHDYAEKRLKSATRGLKPRPSFRNRPDSEQPKWLWYFVCLWLLADIAWLIYTIDKHFH